MPQTSVESHADASTLYQPRVARLQRQASTHRQAVDSRGRHGLEGSSGHARELSAAPDGDVSGHRAQRVARVRCDSPPEQGNVTRDSAARRCGSCNRVLRIPPLASEPARPPLERLASLLAACGC
jgi:hypothetical protein